MEWKYLQERIIVKQTVLNIITDVTQNNIVWTNVFLAGDIDWYEGTSFKRIE